MRARMVWGSLRDWQMRLRWENKMDELAVMTLDWLWACALRFGASVSHCSVLGMCKADWPLSHLQKIVLSSRGGDFGFGFCMVNRVSHIVRGVQVFNWMLFCLVVLVSRWLCFGTRASEVTVRCGTCCFSLIGCIMVPKQACGNEAPA